MLSWIKLCFIKWVSIVYLLRDGMMDQVRHKLVSSETWVGLWKTCGKE